MTILVKDANGTNQTISTTDDLIPVVEAIGSVNDLVAPIEAIGSVNDLVAPVNTVGTRAYNYASIQRITAVTTATLSSEITATEVMVYASTKCYVLPGTTPVATNANSIPIEAGEKFHFRITSGQKISVIRDSVDGFLYIIPVTS